MDSPRSDLLRFSVLYGICIATSGFCTRPASARSDHRLVDATDALSPVAIEPPQPERPTNTQLAEERFRT